MGTRLTGLFFWAAFISTHKPRTCQAVWRQTPEPICVSRLGAPPVVSLGFFSFNREACFYGVPYRPFFLLLGMCLTGAKHPQDL